MKKIIMIAIVLVSGTELFAQNNNDKYSYNKEGLTQNDIAIREAYIQSEIQKEKATAAPVEVIAAPQTNVEVKQEAPAVKKQAETAPVQGPKSDLELRFENATKSGTGGKR